jgi:hypothetical protein
MRRWWRAAAAGAALIAAAGRGGAALRPDAAIAERAVAEGGLLLVRVDPRRGAPDDACLGLGPADFSVTIGGAGVGVVSAKPMRRPERHWLLIDTSESAEERRAATLASAVRYAREVLEPGIDSASILTVDDDLVLRAGPSDDPARLAELIGSAPPGGMSALRDGLDALLRQLAGSRREQLVLFWTDGEDTSSFGTLDELRLTLAATPHATVFPIVLRPARGVAPAAADSEFLFEVARRSGGEVLSASDPRWLDRVRGWLARRYAVGLAFPEEAPAGEVAVAVRDRACSVTILRDPFARPAAVAGAAAPMPRSWLPARTPGRLRRDPDCPSDPALASWEWPWRPSAAALGGCVLDKAAAHGPFAVRAARLAAPPLAALPTDLAAGIASLPQAGDAPSPFVVTGSALLMTRARIAASLFAERADYRDFALARLARAAEDDLTAIERDLARVDPALSHERIVEAARASRDGRRALAAAQSPTDADLAGVIAAWLSDVPAGSLFRAWERRLVDDRIAGRLDPAARARWPEIRTALLRGDEGTVVAPLVLLKDDSRDVVGFRRVIVPRAPEKDGMRDERVPRFPPALAVADRLLARRGWSDRLSAAGYRTARIDEEPVEPAWRVGTGDPFRRTRVTLVLEAPFTGARVVATAEVRALDDGGIAVERLATTVTNDPSLSD